MRNECSIIRDLLPLYAESMVSADTASLVAEHLAGCEACRAECEKAKEPPTTAKASDAAPLLTLNRKLKAKRRQTIALTAIFVIALLFSAFAVLDAPIYLPYSEKLVTLDPLGDKGLLLTFDRKVTGFDYTLQVLSPDAPAFGDAFYCEIQAYTSLWDKWFPQNKAALSAVVTARDKRPILAVYAPNDGSENILLGRYDPNAEAPLERIGERGNMIALPRLTLGYYFAFAVVLLAVLAVAWLFARRKADTRVRIERIGLYPVAYIISHFAICGASWVTYSLPRDFSLIVFISILLYSGLLLAHNVLRLRREISEVNG